MRLIFDKSSLEKIKIRTDNNNNNKAVEHLRQIYPDYKQRTARIKQSKQVNVRVQTTSLA